MTIDLKRPQLRAIQYFYADGSFEFGFGLLCVILATYFYVETHVQGLLMALVDASLVLVMIGGAWLINRLVKRIKESVTYPRTGYIKYLHESGSRRGWRLALGMVSGGLVAAVATVLFTLPNIHASAMPMLSGILLGIVMVVLGLRARLMRFYLLAGLSTLAGIVMAYSGMENILALAVYYLVFGLILITSGIFVLRTYLRRNPVDKEDFSHDQ